MLLVDHDDNSPHHKAYHADHAGQHQEIYTFFTHMFSWTDISDHKGGVLVRETLLVGGSREAFNQHRPPQLLSSLLLAQSGISWYGRRVAVGMGGAKRLNAMSCVVSAALLSPWAIYHFQGLVSTT